MVCCCCCVCCCQVSKHTFLAALKERGAVLFCPGGQAEMVHAWKAFLPEGKRELVLHTRHRGFCRCVLLLCLPYGGCVLFSVI